MRKRYSWDEVIPIDETRIATSYLYNTWNKLSKTEPEQFKYSNREPNLTEALHIYLNLLKGNSGLTGFWANEAQEPRFENNLIKRIKTDIKYQSNHSGSQLDLVFEFKKVSSSNLRDYKGINGMRRFIDGHYSIKQPLAIMVGIVKLGNEDVTDSLFKSLSSSGSKSDLRMVHNENGDYILRPSNALPEVAKFDTEHNRPIDKASITGTTTIAHMFVVSSY